MKGPSAMRAGPGFCFERFGQSTTELPDGRTSQHRHLHEPWTFGSSR
jgi:hypothetical protein